MAWLDAPPEAAMESAHKLLRDLGALDVSGRPTAHGEPASLSCAMLQPSTLPWSSSHSPP
jgi:HrpA-like RNA helicase